MAELRLSFDFRLTAGIFRWGLSGALVSLLAPDLCPETVTLTTYYPAPSGVYAQMITTSHAYLARDTAGRVGLGTTAPLKKLHITHPDGDNLRLERVTGTARSWDVRLGVTGVAATNATSATFVIRDATAGADRVYIDSNGDVGIGKSDPKAPLDVTGPVIIRQSGCSAVNYPVTGSTSCSSLGYANHYATANTGLMTEYTMMPVYQTDSNGSSYGRMWCCPCPGGVCPTDLP